TGIALSLLAQQVFRAPSELKPYPGKRLSSSHRAVRGRSGRCRPDSDCRCLPMGTRHSERCTSAGSDEAGVPACQIPANPDNPATRPRIRKYRPGYRRRLLLRDRSIRCIHPKDKNSTGCPAQSVLSNKKLRRQDKFPQLSAGFVPRVAENKPLGRSQSELRPHSVAEYPVRVYMAERNRATLPQAARPQFPAGPENECGLAPCVGQK